MFQPDECSVAPTALLHDDGERPLPWVSVAPEAPYFMADGVPWTPVGHNDALSWPALKGLLTQPGEVEAYFDMLQRHGVTCLRLMLEYAHRDQHFFEHPAGRFKPRMVARWDRLFALAQRYAVRVLLTPFDTFWMWNRWRHHPYNSTNGGPCASQSQFLTCPAARVAIKRRLAFAIDRWSDSGSLFAWDLWNEIHPAYAQDDVGHFDDFITDIAMFIRQRELDRFGRSHPITVSAFGPMLNGAFASKELGHTMPDPRALDAVFRHPALDFATVHTYAHGTIDDPKNTVAPAIAMGTLTRAALSEVGERRPFLDSEHGPIHTFKDKRRTLPDAFDAEYFRHVQWAHLASGGAGGGMRWPNRHPHVLTQAMHAAQHALSRFLPLVRWLEFKRHNLNEEVRTSPARFVCFACGDERQIVAWVLRRRPRAADGTLGSIHAAEPVTLEFPGLLTGTYLVTTFNTESGSADARFSAVVTDGVLECEVPVARDVALAIRPACWD